MWFIITKRSIVEKHRTRLPPAISTKTASDTRRRRRRAQARVCGAAASADTETAVCGRRLGRFCSRKSERRLQTRFGQKRGVPCIYALNQGEGAERLRALPARNTRQAKSTQGRPRRPVGGYRPRAKPKHAKQNNRSFLKSDLESTREIGRLQGGPFHSHPERPAVGGPRGDPRCGSTQGRLPAVDLGRTLTNFR